MKKVRNIKNTYDWEIELRDGTIVKDHNDFNFDEVVRASFVPKIGLFPRHDVIFEGFKFRKRFCRAMMGWNSQVREYLHILITNSFRLHVKSSNGQCIITPRDYEMRL